MTEFGTGALWQGLVKAMSGQNTKIFDMAIKGDPVAQERPRVFTRGHRVIATDPPKSRKGKQAIQLQAQAEYRGEVLDEPLEVVLRFFMRRGRTVTRAEHTVKPDLDNLMKTVLDAMNGIVWKDDSAIVRVIACKQYTEGDPFTLVEVFSHTPTPKPKYRRQNGYTFTDTGTDSGPSL